MFILTVRPPDNILQKSILRSHKSPATPRHSVSSIRRHAGERFLGRVFMVWAAHRRCVSVLRCSPILLISCLLLLFFSPVRCVQACTFIHETKCKARVHRTGGGRHKPHASLTGPGAPPAGHNVEQLQNPTVSLLYSTQSTTTITITITIIIIHPSIHFY